MSEEELRKAALYLARACNGLLSAVKEVERRRSGDPGTLLTNVDLDAATKRVYEDISAAVTLLEGK